MSTTTARPDQPNKRRSRKRTVGFVFATLFFIGITTILICGVAFALYVHTYIMPEADLDLSSLSLNYTSVIYYEDANGETQELAKLHGSENRIWVDLEDIPEYLGDAFISIEDERFESHNGVDWKRTFSAAVNWLIPIRSSFGGGSTITQQLIKNVTSEDDFSIQRKLKEIFRALNLEKQMDKDEILELYMNSIYFGRSAYGVQTAARTYFDKDVQDLTLAECAVIAAITNNPSYYDPFRYPENTEQRKDLVLEKMLENDKITQAEYDEAMAQELVYTYGQSDDATGGEVQSYFVDEVVNDVIEDLVELGYSENAASNILYGGGLQIYATIDVDIQNIMEDVYENRTNFPDITGKNGAEPQSAMIIMDPYTGEIKGIVGGRDEKEGARVLNRATQSARPPGSSIKPISVYGPAIDDGLITPYSPALDAPVNYTDRSSGWPRNVNGRYDGPTTIEHAVTVSTNTVAVRTLELLGIENSYNFLEQNLHISTLVDSQVTASGSVQTDKALAPLALGGLTRGVTVEELTAAYTPILNNGLYSEAHTYTKVLDANGVAILEHDTEPTVAFENEKTAYYMRDMLYNVVNASGGSGQGAQIAGMETGGKTGSTTDNRDRWFVGFTPYYIGTVWYGYDENYELPSISNPAVTIWNTVMERVQIDIRITCPTGILKRATSLSMPNTARSPACRPPKSARDTLQPGTSTGATYPPSPA